MSVSDAVRELYAKFVESELRSDLYINSEGMKNRFWRKHAFCKDRTHEELSKARALFEDETEIPYDHPNIATIEYCNDRFEIQVYALRENVTSAIAQIKKEGRTDIHLIQ
jgi:zona occludens toxin (predicted ATPase)